MKRLILPVIVAAAAALSLLSARTPVVPEAARPTLSDTVPPIVFDGVDGALVGLYIEDIATGEAVAEYGADLALCPASILKSVTCASVMSLYPADRCFVTRVATTGPVADGVLRGDIVVYGSGDPTLASDYFDFRNAMPDSLVAALRRNGIDSVAGDIVIDSDALPDPSYPPGWGRDDFMWPYGAMLRALNWRDNRYTLRLPSRTTDPFIPGLKVDFTPRRRGKVGLDAMPPLTTVKAWGRVSRGGVSERLAMPDPAAAFRHAMIALLADSGIGCGKAHFDFAPGAPAEHLTEVLSPSFPAIMRSLMHRSDNLMAEGMMRTIAPRQPRDTAAARELALWALRGVDTDSVRIVDGSGLSRLNRVTTWFMADVLTWMARSPKAMDYVGLFPVVGREGTVKRFLAGTPLEGRMCLKTGTMSGVRALAGFKLDDEGMPTHAVVLIVNRYSCSAQTINKAAETFFLNFFS